MNVSSPIWRNWTSTRFSNASSGFILVYCYLRVNIYLRTHLILITLKQFLNFQAGTANLELQKAELDCQLEIPKMDEC